MRIYDNGSMADATRGFRDHLLRVLDWEDAHVGFDKAVSGIPADKRGARAAGFEYSPWELLEHIRIAQDDILAFCLNEAYQHTMNWPADYWPKAPAPPSDDAWDKSVAAYKRSLVELKRVVHEVEDLTATVPTGKDNQTYLRSILLTADHTAYHVGQLVALGRRWACGNDRRL